jgi:hypothetical protein
MKYAYSKYLFIFSVLVLSTVFSAGVAWACVSNAECDDADPLTTDICSDGVCEYSTEVEERIDDSYVDFLSEVGLSGAGSYDLIIDMARPVNDGAANVYLGVLLSDLKPKPFDFDEVAVPVAVVNWQTGVARGLLSGADGAATQANILAIVPNNVFFVDARP